MTVAFRVNKYCSGASLFVLDLIPWYKKRKQELIIAADILRSYRKLRACCPADHLRRIHSSAGTGAPSRDQRTSVQINDATHGQDRCQGRGGAGAALSVLAPFQPEREEAQRHSLKLWRNGSAACWQITDIIIPTHIAESLAAQAVAQRNAQAKIILAKVPAPSPVSKLSSAPTSAMKIQESTDRFTEMQFE